MFLGTGCIDAVCAHVILRHNNGLTAVVSLPIVTQDNNDITARPMAKTFPEFRLYRGADRQVKH